MKKRILLTSLMSFCLASVFAQNVNTGKPVFKVARSNENDFVAESNNAATVKGRTTPLYKVTATPFVTENFGSGTSSTLPTGWTSSGSFAASTWKWRNTACTGQFNIGTISSTTASNGWLVFDSDSIGSVASAPTSGIFDGSLISPAYNCTGHTSVGLNFQEYFRNWYDTCWVEVTNDNWTTTTTYPIVANNNMTPGNATTNPYNVKVNISSVAANKPSVKIKFRYNNYAPGGAYNWLIDDISLSELDSVDLAINKAGFAMKGVSGVESFTSFGSIPRQLLDSIIPVETATNLGKQISTASVNCNIYNGSTSFYSNTFTMTPFAQATPAAPDTTFEFPIFYNNTPGNYTVSYFSEPTGDVDLSNNLDTIKYSISDTIYHRNTNKILGGYYIHRAPNASTGATERSFSMGNTFIIPSGKSDTLTHIYACFGSTTTVSSKVVANIFKFNSSTTSWDYIGGTKEKVLSSSDISSSTSAVLASFDLDPNTLTLPYVMQGGLYAVVLQGKNVPVNSTVTVNSTGYTCPSTLDYLHGVSDTSLNDGYSGFGGTGNNPYKATVSPIIQLCFGKYIVGISEVHPFTLEGSVYPNPARNEFTVAFTTTETANVNVTVTNTIGQVVKAVNAGQNPAGVAGKTTINVADLTPGVYFCTIEANGQRSTKRIVVTH